MTKSIYEKAMEISEQSMWSTDIVDLENWRYHVEMGFGSDSWCISGTVFNHPNHVDRSYITISSPKKFDENKMILITASGRIYKLGNCSDDLKQQIKYIREDIRCGGSLIL